MGEKQQSKHTITRNKSKDAATAPPAAAAAVWFSLKKSLHCKSHPSDVHDPTHHHLRAILRHRKPATARSGCSRSIANLKDVVIHGSKRHFDNPPNSNSNSNCSPRSIGSGDFFNPITHQVIFTSSHSNSKSDLKTGILGTSSPGTPYHPRRKSASATPPRKREGPGSHHWGSSPVSTTLSSSKRSSFDNTSTNNNDNIIHYGNNVVACHKCGDHFPRFDALESHHLSRHAVTELVEGDSSRKIVEIICRSSLIPTKPPESHTTVIRIDRILKVHNTPRILSRFEDYRESVKLRASKWPKKHPRCLADGNELLRFHGTNVACSLGSNGSSRLCTSDRCSACRIIKHGFSTARGGGVFTASTSSRAHEAIQGDRTGRKALMVCRVIAGRVHRPVEEIAGVSLAGFDSLAGKVGLYSNIEELYLLNPKALLPCFVVICKA